MAQFKKRVFGENVSKEVIEEFKKLAGGGLDGTSLQPLETRKPTFEKYLGERTPFSRMWCAVNINTLDEIPPNGEQIERHEDGFYFYYPKDKDATIESNRIQIGNDKNSHTKVFVVNENTEESYTNNNPLESIQSDGVQSLQQIKQLKNNPLMKPAAGITSVTSKTQGALGALQNTTVEFVVHNKHDFENIFLPFFLKPGSVVCIDYGWSDISFSLYNPIDQIKDNPLDMSTFDEFIYGDMKQKKGFLAKNYGKVNTTMGNVISYEANVTVEGSYNCSLEVVSRNTGLLDREVSDDNELKFIFSNAIQDILVNVLASASGNDVKLSLNQLTDRLSSVDPIDTTNEAKLFFEQIFKFNPNLGIITPFASKYGIFYQDLSPDTARFADAAKKYFYGETADTAETTYISFGLFEDLFLNNFVAGVIPIETDREESDDNPRPFTKDPTKDFSNKFDSRLVYIRWDEDLVKIQKQKLASNESLTKFMVPDNWDDSYNSRVLKDDEKYDSTLGKWRVNSEDSKNGRHPKYLGKNVMPLRDLFVSVPLIANAFRSKETVNDAIIFILDALNLDSNKVWNLKLMGDFGKSSISIKDTNLIPELPEEKDMLIFDVTGEESIVSQCDLKFTTPKAGLSSMIAIGNLNGPQYFNQTNLSALNHLNLLNQQNVSPDKKTPTVVKSLPLQGVTNKKLYKRAVVIDLEQYTKRKKNLLVDKTTAGQIKEKFEAYKKNIKEKQEEKESEDKPGRVNVKNYNDNIEVVSSYREYYKTRIRTKLYDQSGVDKISPILPVELDLSIYGNNYLQIGDYYNINYLPKQYRENIFFQIVGIEDKIDVNGWSTSYTSVMRVKPDKKNLVTGNVKPMDIYLSREVEPITFNTIESKNGFMGGSEETIKSFCIGYLPYESFKLKEYNPHLSFEIQEWKIAPFESWVKPSKDSINGEENRIAAFQLARYFNSMDGDDVLSSVNELSYHMAVRDVLLAKENKIFSHLPSNQSIRFERMGAASFNSTTLSSNRSGQDKNLVGWVGHHFNQSNVIDFPNFSNFISQQEGKVLKAIQDITFEIKPEYYIFPDSEMYVEIDRDRKGFLTGDITYKVPKFIQLYQFALNVQDNTTEPQFMYKVKVPEVDGFSELMIPKWLINPNTNIIEIVNLISNKFMAYRERLNEQVGAILLSEGKSK